MFYEGVRSPMYLSWWFKDAPGKTTILLLSDTKHGSFSIKRSPKLQKGGQFE